ncbi:hypothetical protein ACFL0R_03155 [Pseudomonadota bacterium]
MTEIDSLYLMLLFELLALLSVVCAAMVVVLLLRARRERRAINRLVGLVKEDSGRRQEETRSLLEKRFGYEGEASKKIARKLSRKELGFYQTLINLFIKRDAKAMAELNIVFEDAVAPYRELDVSKQAAAQEVVNVVEKRTASVSPEEESPEAEDDGELQRLRIENQQLLAELQLTMNTLGGMLSQYSAMCEGDADAGAEAMAKMLDEGEDSTSAGDESAALAEEAVSDAAGLVDDLEPNWDEALTEQLAPGSADEAKAEEGGDEAEPSWDEALTEQLEPDSTDDAKAGEASAEAEPNWDDALGEQLEQGAAAEPEPSWDEALGEQLDPGQEEAASGEQEPSWDDALDEQQQDGQAEKG